MTSKPKLLVLLKLHVRCASLAASHCDLDGHTCDRCGEAVTRPGYGLHNDGRMVVETAVFCRPCGDVLLATPGLLEAWETLMALKA